MKSLLKKSLGAIVLAVIATVITTSCNLSGQVPGGLHIYSGMRVFVPKAQFTMQKLNSDQVYVDEGRPSNTAAAMNVNNSPADGKADYINNGAPYRDIVVAVDVNGDGIVDVINDPLTGGSKGAPMEYNTFIGCANGTVTHTLVTFSGVEGYWCMIYFSDYVTHYSGCTYSGQLNGVRYSTRLEFLQ